MRTKVFLIFFLSTQLVFGGLANAQEKPFWRQKQKVFNKIVEERAIIVSVNAKPIGGAKSQLDMVGGGLTRLTYRVAYAKALKYEDLKKVSDHIREVRWNPGKQELYVHTEAFRYHARMLMKIEELAQAAPHESQIRFRVIDGHFKGMEGRFSFEDYKGRSCLMGFQSTYQYEKLPMPTFFIEFGLEIVLQKVAGLMRQYLEKP